MNILLQITNESIVITNSKLNQGDYMEYLAHISEDKRKQSVLEHLEGTAKLALRFGNEFGAGDWAEVLGLMHDLGKYSKEFQARLLENAPRCDHSTAGAKVLLEDDDILFARLLAHCIAGHHSGLQDWGSNVDNEMEGTLKGRLSVDYVLPDYSSYKSEMNCGSILKRIQKRLPDLDWTFEDKHKGFILTLFTRMLYSCLVDADFLDTEYFMLNGNVERGIQLEVSKMKRILDGHMDQLQNKSKPSIINTYRQKILQSCILASQNKRGLFTLTVPTGGGKTLSSVAFALNHCIKNDIRRIIYVIPYTSIIEQNAEVFTNIFGDDTVLEHHSNYDWDDNENRNRDLKKLASENWDMPLIVTTNVQFFESLFANKSSRCRKLHNIANSIIIFDEAQMIALNYLQPCISVIQELVSNYRCSAVLCSATQPAIQNMITHKLPVVEICDNWRELHEVFRRTNIHFIGTQTNEALIAKMENLTQCLIIVNTRKHARELSDVIEGEGVYHLSTLMCNQHRSQIISEIKEKLSKKERCIVISTRLIEAGVDLDFPVVFRAISGLDSIIQAAGRCNREGKMKDDSGHLIRGDMYVFEPEEKYYKNQPKSFQMPIEITKVVMSKFDDVACPEAIEMFFKEMYFYSGEKGLDTREIMKRLDSGLDFSAKPGDNFKFSFNEIAKDFRLIESNTYAVIIPYNCESEEAIKQLQFGGPSVRLMRKLQKYTVNVYEHELNRLHEAGILKEIGKGVYVLLEKGSGYDDTTGLKVCIETGISIFI